MKRMFLLSIMIAVLSVGYGFAETRSGCIDDAQNAVCKKDIAMMGMEMTGGMTGHGDHGMASSGSGHGMVGHSHSSHGNMMQRGSASEEEMHVLHQKLNGTENTLGHIH